jgi:hypothetical protein
MTRTTTRYLYIDSADRNSGGTSTNFQIALNYAMNNITKIKLQSLTFFNTLYNITAAFNNTIPFSIGATNFTAVIPAGAYNITTFAPAVQAALNAVSTGFTVAYNPLTYKLTISNASAFSLLWGTGPTCSTECGFPDLPTAAATSVTGPNAVNLGEPCHLFVMIREIDSSFVVGGDSFNNYTFVVPINSPPGFLVEYSCNSSFNQIIECQTPLNLSKLTIQLNNSSNPVGNPSVPTSLNGLDWQMVLEIDQQW